MIRNIQIESVLNIGIASNGNDCLLENHYGAGDQISLIILNTEQMALGIFRFLQLNEGTGLRIMIPRAGNRKAIKPLRLNIYNKFHFTSPCSSVPFIVTT